MYSLLLWIVAGLAILFSWAAAFGIKTVGAVIVVTALVWGATWLFFWQVIGLPIWHETQTIFALPVLIPVYGFTVGAVTQLLVLSVTRPEAGLAMWMKWGSFLCVFGAPAIFILLSTNFGNAK